MGPRIFVYDGDCRTYQRFRFVGGPEDFVLAVDPKDEATWEVVASSVDHKLARWGGRPRVNVVGNVPVPLLVKLEQLARDGRALVRWDPEPGDLVRRELSTGGARIRPILVGREDELALAVHAASLLRQTGEAVLPTTDPEMARWALATGRVERAIELGVHLPAVARVAPPEVATFPSAQELLVHAMGGGQGDNPPSDVKTLAVYTGLEYPDSPSCPAPAPCGVNHLSCVDEPLSFYNSECVALELCNGRVNCMPHELYPTPPPDTVFDLTPPGGAPKGWQVDIEPVIDAAIATYVTNWNTANPSTPITKLAVVSHPLDIPYRRFLFPYYDCSSCVGVACGVDSGYTNNTVPHDDGCEIGVLKGDRWDGNTGSADFEYANIVTELTYPLAELAYSRVAGQRLCDAMIQVCSNRFVLGYGCGVGCSGCPPITPPLAIANGAHLLSIYSTHYDTFRSLWNDFYTQAVPGFCEPPQDSQSSTPFCPTNADRCAPMTYLILDDWIQKIQETQTPMELGMIYGHQDRTPELPQGGIPNGSEPLPSYIDRQRVQFFRNVAPPTECPQGTPDQNAPMYTSEWIRANGIQDLAPGLWFIKATAAGNYNYLNRFVRDTCLGPDSSFLSTVVPSGVAGEIIKLSPNPGQVYFAEPESVLMPRMMRELSFGKPLGEVIRNVGNFSSTFQYLAPAKRFQHEFMAYGDPDLILHVPFGAPGPGSDDIVLLASPGPGADGDNQSIVVGLNKEGANIGYLDFLAYDPALLHGANLASGNIDGSPGTEIVTGQGHGFGSSYPQRVRAFDETGAPIPQVDFYAYSISDGGGVNVATIDYDGDNIDEIMTAPGPGSSSAFAPFVRLWNYDGGTIPPTANVSFLAFPTGYYGSNVAGGNILPSVGSGEEALVGRGPDPGVYASRMRVWTFVFNPTTQQHDPVLTALVGNPPSPMPSTHGVYVAVGPLDNAFNGAEDFVLGAGPVASDMGTVLAYSGGLNQALSTQTPLYQFQNLMNEPDGGYGVRVATTNADADTRHEIVVGRGNNPKEAPNFENGRVRIIDTPFCGTPPCTNPVGILDVPAFPEDGPGVTHGINVAGISLLNVSLPRLRGSGRGNGIPASPVATPRQALGPIPELVRDISADVLRDPGSRARLAASAAALESLIDRGSFQAAEAAAAVLRGAMDAEITLASERDAMTWAVARVEEALGLQLSDLPPVARVEGPPGSVCPSLYTFSAMDSFDPDDRGLSRSDIQGYSWTLDGQPLPERSDAVTIPIPAGQHIVGVTVTDTFGLTDTTSLTIDAVDTSAPEGPLELIAGEARGDGMVEVEARLSVRDACGGSVAVSLAEVSIEGEPCDAAIHVADAALGSDDRRFFVGACNGRTQIYRVTYEARDSSGNAGRMTSIVEVTGGAR